MQTTQTRVIDLADLTAVRKSVEKANRKAEKIGVSGYELFTGAIGSRDITAPDLFHPGAWKVVGQIATIEVTVVGEAPKYAGWVFIATLAWDGDEVVVRKIEGLPETLDTTKARPFLKPLWCDHCNTARDRNETYLLWDGSTGAWKQVGSTCLREFLGVEVNLALIGYNPYENCDSTNRYEPERLYVAAVLQYAVGATRLWGWVSATFAQGNAGHVATKRRVETALWDRRAQGDEYRRCIAEASRETDAALIADIIAWVQKLDAGHNEYLANLKAAVGDGVTSRTDNLGLLVSAPNAYQRWLDREATRFAERRAQVTSGYVGTVGQKLADVAVTVIRSQWCSTDYGSSLLVLFRDADGNVFKWFASNPPRVLETTGTQVLVSGTVKKHEKYNDLKSTVLTRCKVKEIAA